MATYGGTEPGPALEFHSLLSRGDSANVSAFSMGSHTGSRVDAPSHFIDGATSVEQMPLDALIGPAQVIEHNTASHITAADLESAGLAPDTLRLLIKTPNGRFWEDDSFHSDFVGLA